MMPTPISVVVISMSCSVFSYQFISIPNISVTKVHRDLLKYVNGVGSAIARIYGRRIQLITAELCGCC